MKKTYYRIRPYETHKFIKGYSARGFVAETKYGKTGKWRYLGGGTESACKQFIKDSRGKK